MSAPTRGSTPSIDWSTTRPAGLRVMASNAIVAPLGSFQVSRPGGRKWPVPGT
ncbi:MAG: hypothetical protein ACR2MO_00625 [Acidimicrobiales bacterium]